MFALALGLSVAGLLVGPALLHWARGRALFETALDGVTLGLIPALILVRLLPELAGEVGLLALALFALGYFGYSWMESRTHVGPARLGTDLVTMALAAHALTDGAALAVAFRGAGWIAPSASAILVGALIVHKIPEGLFVASALLRSVGMRAALRRIAVIGLANVVGGVGGREFLQLTPEAALHGLFAVGLGIMLRVVVHRHGEPERAPRARLVGALCFLAGVVVALSVPSPRRLLSQGPE